MSSLWYKGRFQCGCVIIHVRFVLTAAHCLPSNFTLSKVQVFVSSDSLGSGIAYTVSRVIIHHQYQGFVYNDIAVLVLSEPLQLSDAVYPVCLPQSKYPQVKPGTRATVIGFGTYYYGESVD